jgi:predicted HTH transcriptional regulator
MAEITAEIKDEDCMRREAAGDVAHRIEPSMRNVANMSLEDLDQGLVLGTLASYCETLHRAPVTQENYVGLLLEQGLLGAVDGVLRPTMGCYLLFGREVAKWFPHASVTVTRNCKQRRVFDGNLLSQFQALVEYLDSSELNPVLRVKGAIAATEQKAYPKRVITEAVVNLLVHRDYAIEDFATIEAEPGVGLVFRNPGGISERLRSQLEIDSDGNFSPVRNITEIRNPSLADIFFGIGSMDKAGSGLADVQELMLENGGNASFTIEHENQVFRANLFQPVQRAPGESKVARPVAPIVVSI